MFKFSFLAFYLATRSNISKIRLFEATSRLSGWISSENFDGYFFESAARTLRPKGLTGNTTLELIQLLGLENKILPITSDRVSGKFRLTWSQNQISTVTPDIDAKLKDLFGSEASDNESIYSFAERKFGKEFADYVITPMVHGICAGDAKEISAKFLVKGRRSATFEENDLYKKARSERWSFYSLQGGIETLPKSIAEKLSQDEKVSMNLDSMCKKIHFEADGTVKVTINEEVHTASHVVSALPGLRLAALVEHQHPELANELMQLKGGDVATVNLHYKSENLLKEKGFGVFVPATENSPVLGIIFDSCCFDMTGTCLTAMLGGKWLNSNPDDQTLLDTSLQHVKNILGITDKPDNFKVTVMKKSFPQYTVGHYERLERIKDYIKSNKLPLSFCGQSFDGIGINEVILSSKEAANAIKL